MPIFLDDLQANSSVPKVYSPKFFDTKLTGVGKKTGILNENRNPGQVPSHQTTSSENTSIKKRHYTNGSTEVSIVPVNILSTDAWTYMHSMPLPDKDRMALIATMPADPKRGISADAEVYLMLEPHSIVIEETRLTSYGSPAKGGGSAGISKKCVPSYQLFLFACERGAAPDYKVMQTDYLSHLLPTYATSGSQPVGEFYQEVTCNPKKMAIAAMSQLTSDGYTVDPKAIDDYIDDYSLYDGMCRKSEQWQTTIHLFLDNYFMNIAAERANGSNACMNNLAAVLRRIEDYKVPLDLYRDIYASIHKYFNQADSEILCKENLNLLLSDTLHNLNANKAQLSAIPVQNPPVQVPVRKVPFSPEQRKAITCTDPLVLVQSGAGTGKSSTILGRIDWMIACGIQPHDIMVLSFTNAAADHITDLNPDIHSMTIARMIHTIYTMNFPGHELSTLDTIMNSIDIYFGYDDMAVRFKQVCKSVWKNDPDGFTKMNNFIERHYDEVMKILDTIHQTSLELEIIICYQRIEHLQEPPEVQSKYLIIDEVQDNSIFEFIYTLKYVDKHNEALFIVGDCSQTLYEFRASNPKALNILEGSGVFTTHQLQVNYRSNQEILDFANVALRDIEANQYANIQLRANSLKQVTEQSFTDAVHFKYYRLTRLGDLQDKMVTIFANDLKPYVDACLARGEHVAFLAFTRQTIGMAEEHIKALWPGKTVVKLIPDKTHNTTIFSDFIRNRWDQVKFAPNHKLVDVIVRAVMDDLSHMSGKNAAFVQSKAANMLDDWKNQYGVAIANWQAAYVNGQLTLDQLMDNTRDTLLSFEIAANAMKQALMSQRNRELKEANAQVDADFILSTIHSAKGLEFENVVVFYRNDNTQEEDKKRMYYVAFTRAMLSEFIVAYDTVSSPAIEMHYKGIVDNLHRIAPNTNASIQAQAIANAQAILAAQAAGKTVLAVSGQPRVLAVASMLDNGETLTYAKDLTTLDTVKGLPTDGAQVFSKVMDNTSAIAQAQALIDAMNVAAEEAEERRSAGRRPSGTSDQNDGQEAAEA